MRMRGPKRGQWRDYRGDESGDVLDFYAVHALGLCKAADDFPAVLAGLADFCGLRPCPEPERAERRAKQEAREAERQRKAEAEEREEAARKLSLVETIRAASLPFDGSPAQTYWSEVRRIPRLPPAEAVAFLPAGALPPKIKGVLYPQLPALVVWARDSAGRIVGGQRILLTPSSERARDAAKKPLGKPSFATIGKAAAKLPALDPFAGGGAIILCEGPETAGAVWSATGAETWAVFGAGGFAGALRTVERGRRVILCPDCDAPGSPAAEAFNRAAEDAARAGAEIWIARAPEAPGSKRDLADTLAREGLEAVRKAVEAAERLEPPPPEGPAPFYPDRGLPPQEGGKAHRDTAAAWGASSIRLLRAKRALGEAYAEIDAAGLAPKEARRRKAQARKAIAARFALASWKPPRTLLSGAQGVGKTQALLDGIAGAHGLAVAVYVPTLEKAKEARAAYEQKAAETRNAPPSMVRRGRGALRPDAAEGERMCELHEAADRIAKAGGNVRETLCLSCPFAEGCAWLEQERELQRRLEGPEGVVAFMAHAYATVRQRRPFDLIAFDERPHDLLLEDATLPLDGLGEEWPEPKRKLSRAGKAAARADFFAKGRPVLVALERALRDAPGRELAALREAGFDAKAIAEAAASLGDFEERSRADAIGGAVSEWRFKAADRGAALDGAALGRMIEGRVAEKAPPRLRALRLLLRAVADELETPRDGLTSVRVEPGREGRVVIVSRLAEPAFSRKAPFLHLDGTGDASLAEAWFGPLEHRHIPVERDAEVVQIVGATFSNQSIIGKMKDGEPLAPEREAEAERRRAQLAGFFAREARGRPAFVSGNKRVLEALAPPLPAGSETAHFGALRGLNRAEHCETAFVIGREQPRAAAVEHIARAFAAKRPEPFVSLGAGRYPTEARARRMRDGSASVAHVEHHPDPTADRILRQIREAEIAQAADRVRPIFNRRRIFLLSPVVADMTVDRVIHWREVRAGGSRIERALAGSGVLPLGASELCRIHPELWGRLATARSDLRAAGLDDMKGRRSTKWVSLFGRPSSFALIACYATEPRTPGGKVGQPQRALILAESEEAARNRLEAVAGPLRRFAVEEVIAPPAPAEERPPLAVGSHVPPLTEAEQEAAALLADREGLRFAEADRIILRERQKARAAETPPPVEAEPDHHARAREPRKALGP